MASKISISLIVILLAGNTPGFAQEEMSVELDDGPDTVGAALVIELEQEPASIKKTTAALNKTTTPTLSTKKGHIEIIVGGQSKKGIAKRGKLPISD